MDCKKRKITTAMSEKQEAMDNQVQFTELSELLTMTDRPESDGSQGVTTRSEKDGLSLILEPCIDNQIVEGTHPKMVILLCVTMWKCVFLSDFHGVHSL